jgi:hypothetical protein
MKKQSKYLGWSALIVFAFALFAPAIVSFNASAAPEELEPAQQPERCIRQVSQTP